MKKILSLVAMAMMATAAHADDVSVEQALQVARQFYLAQQKPPLSSPQGGKIPKAIAPSLAYSVKSLQNDTRNNIYVVNLGEEQGYVVVSGETGTVQPVLGYCDSGSFSEEDMPCCLRALLTQYSAQIDHLRSVSSHPRTLEGICNPRPPHPRKISGIGNVVVEPLVTTRWNQEAPYNNLCPIIDDIICHAGCGPVAVAQVMAYWKYPQQGRGSFYYYWQPWLPTILTHFDWGRDFSNSVYDWDNMIDDYSAGYTEQQGDAVALLMADVGAAMYTIYGNDKRGSTSSPMRPEIILPKYFDYNPDSIRTIKRYLSHGNGETDNFDQLIKQDLDKHRPVILAAQPSRDIADHFIVVDGYTDTDYFHMNFGWSGSGDSYYMTTAIDTSRPNNIENRWELEYIEQVLICGICPSYSIREGDNYFYIADGQAILNYSGTTDALTVPSTFTTNGTTYPVAKISRMACYENETLASVQIPLSVKEIGERAFYRCGNLTTVTAPENQSPALYENTLPEQLTTMGPYAFARTGLPNINVPASLHPIPDYAFYRCDQLKEISFFAKELGTMAFGRCSSRPSVYFFHDIDRLGDGAFFYHGVDFIFVGNVKHIGNDCLSSSNLDIVTLDKIETIGWNQAIVKPDGTVVIGKDAPIKSLRRYAPLHHSSFTVVEEGNPNFVSVNNTVYSKDRKTLVHFGWKNDQPNAYGLYETRSELTVPATVKRINDFAIYNNPHLKKLTIPATVNEIGVGNFPNGAEVFNYATMPQPVKLLLKKEK